MAGALLENVFTGERVAVGVDGRLALKAVFAEFPVALFVREQ
jgi:maltooligosyltrehalose synthase